jgi:hypothetical protein
MIVRVLSLGSYWREPNDGRPVVWNSSGVLDQRGLRPRSKVSGCVRFNSRLYQEAQGTSGLRGSSWHASLLGEHLGIRKLELRRRVRRNSLPDWYLVSVTEQLVGTLDHGSWDPIDSLLVSFSEWKARQEALLLVGRHGWLRGRLGSAVLTPGGPDSDWKVNGW